MEKKYYTPEESEFHLGFEYEVDMRHVFPEEVDSPTWHKYKASGMMSAINFDLSLEKGMIRVKHLDQEDIESFGFDGDEMEMWKDEKHRFLYHKKVETKKGKENVSILHVPSTSWVLIYFSTGELGSYVWEMPEDKITFTGGAVFAGKIKNKSELKRILTQTGVI